MQISNRILYPKRMLKGVFIIRFYANYAKLTSMHFYAWKSGLKTGMYYLRTKSAVNATQFTVSNIKKEEETPLTPEELRQMILQSKENPDDCEMCGS